MKVTKAGLNVWLMAWMSLINCAVSQYDESMEIKIGGIFYKGSNHSRIFELADNMDLKNSTRLKTVVKEVDYGDIVAAGEHVCDLAKEGVYGIVDATEGRTSAYIQAICDTLEMPHIITHHNYLQSKNWSAINLYPSAATYNRILMELIQKKEWQNFTIMYVRGHDISRVNSLLELNSKLELYSVTVRELSGDNYRPAFSAAKNKGSTNFLVDCPADKLTQVLRQAQEVGLMSNKHSYIFTSPDLPTLNLDNFKYGGANITGFSLVNFVDDEVVQISAQLGIEGTLVLDMALVYDAALVCARAYEKMPVIPSPIVCQNSNQETWKHGSSIVNIMRTFLQKRPSSSFDELGDTYFINMFKGLTKEVLFDSDGQRSNFTIDVFELTRAGIVNVALWKDHLKIIREYIKLSSEDGSIMSNKTFTVLITMTEPFGYEKETVDEMSGNDRYEGFAVDVIEELSVALGFSYILQVEESSGKLEDGKWDGMVQKIMDNEADFGICDFTITHDRLRAIDFTTPFMSVGISILYKKPSKQPPAMFSFMEPFSKDVWMYMLFAQIALGVVMVFVGRISHKEWHNPFPCVERPESLDNQFSLANAIWLIIGSVMQQGSEIAPIALAPRTVTSVWWFFTMVMIASYTGTLVSFLTVESNTLTFKTAEDLADQSYIAYGARYPGATLKFFETSGNPVYRRMYKNMERRNHEWCAGPELNWKNGRERVQAGRYAFFMESAAIEYELERHCDLMQVGDLLDNKNYGIGMMKNSKYREAMSNKILKMKETGTLQKLKDKWWKERRGGGACTDAGKSGDPTQLEMKNMIGAFVVLGVGCFIGIFISILDMLWGVYKRTIKYNTKYSYELVEELRFALKFRGDTKPVPKRPQTLGEDTEVEKMEAKDDLDSLRSNFSLGSGDTRRTRQSGCTHRSSRSQSLAFARRRRYSS